LLKIQDHETEQCCIDSWIHAEKRNGIKHVLNSAAVYRHLGFLGMVGTALCTQAKPLLLFIDKPTQSYLLTYIMTEQQVLPVTSQIFIHPAIHTQFTTVIIYFSADISNQYVNVCIQYYEFRCSRNTKYKTDTV
jgi:hypothetical protein